MDSYSTYTGLPLPGSSLDESTESGNITRLLSGSSLLGHTDAFESEIPYFIHVDDSSTEAVVTALDPGQTQLPRSSVGVPKMLSASPLGLGGAACDPPLNSYLADQPSHKHQSVMPPQGSHYAVDLERSLGSHSDVLKRHFVMQAIESMWETIYDDKHARVHGNRRRSHEDSPSTRAFHDATPEYCTKCGQGTSIGAVDGHGDFGLARLWAKGQSEFERRFESRLDALFNAKERAINILPGHSKETNNILKCKYCPKTAKRQCDLRCQNCAPSQRRSSLQLSSRKHAKRHKRLYCCTHGGCRKDFGSKDDWKRHERKRHGPFEAWWCGELIYDPSRPDTCTASFNEREGCVEHLRHSHRINDLGTLQKELDRRRIGGSQQHRFWCGFCAKVIRLEGADALDTGEERFNHLGNHMAKENARRDQWSDVVENLSRTGRGEVENLDGLQDQAEDRMVRISHLSFCTARSSIRRLALCTQQDEPAKVVYTDPGLRYRDTWSPNSKKTRQTRRGR